jgi:geranylgeranyl pyrophosphate synthase
MDIYKLTMNYISNQPVLTAWEDARSLMDHAASMQPHDWQLPIISCEALGCKAEDVIPICASLACAQVGIILVDDMLDEDPRGEYHRLGMSRTANIASALLLTALQVIFRSEAQPSIKLEAAKNMDLMITTVAYGQDLDIKNPADEIAYWRVVQAKSAPYFGTALELGALFAGASNEIVQQVGQIGRLYGEMIQIHDDLNDCMTRPAGPDWLTGRSPLPILFAQIVDHSERVRFLELRKLILEPEALLEAQHILIHCGAVSYCIDQLLRRYEAANEILQRTKLPDPDKLSSLLRNLITPISGLLGMEERQLLTLSSSARDLATKA